MNFITYDCEVFAYDWLVVFKDKKTGIRTRIWNDNEALAACLGEDNVYFGFNSKYYDQYIVKAIVSGRSPQEIKQISDWIIANNMGWQHPLLQGVWVPFNNADIKDDMQKGLSLKSIEGHLGLPIRESSVPFDIDRPLTKAERREVEEYCDYDVDTTERLLDIRKDYLKTKINLGKRSNIPIEKSLSMTNAKITAAMLGAVRKEWNDGRKYVYPENLDKSIIPSGLIDFFNTIYDESIPEKELFKTSIEIDIGGMPTKYAWGGVHGSLVAYHEATTESRVLQNRDVSSLYPALIVEYNYLSRNVPNREVYVYLKEERLVAKGNGDKATANDLKLPLNTVSGAQENEYNDLYDPLPTRSLRISGQLFLTVLAIRLIRSCSTVRLLNFNTDGILYSIDKHELSIADKVCAEWERETRFELEAEEVDRIWLKDVNNYIEVQSGGEVKLKGGYLVRGMITDHSDPLSGKSGGAWNINNNARIVAMALKEHFVSGTSVEETIENCDDLFQFQIIAKAGQKYKEAYHLVDNVPQSVQRVNRVYATKNERYGKLFKVKADTDASAKIELLPDHCIIDNENQLTIEDIDKSFYIELAKKRVNEFLGIKPEKARRTKKMATAKATVETKPKNVYQKLITARRMFLEENVQKSGKNMHLEFKYFELEDIVPTAIRIFEDLGLTPIVGFTPDTASLQIVNADVPDESVSFMAPFNQISPIVSNSGKEVTNPMQALGSSITYMRRYLYMIALDICESDSIDGNIGHPVPSQPPAHTAPATPQQRSEAKVSLTSPDGKASDLQVKQLKSVLKKLREARPEKSEMIQKIELDTEGFTKISKVDCENLITGISKLLGESVLTSKAEG